MDEITNPNKNKKTILTIVAVIAIIGLGVAGYFYWKKYIRMTPEEAALEESGKAAETITESAVKGVLPSITTNPLEDKPDISPTAQTNPFKDLQTNPFAQ